jgi:prevent-host-death family protein
VKVKLSESVKPISYFKANAAAIIKNLSEKNGTLIITQNGEAKAVVQDIETYEQTQESLAMLKILAMSKKGVSEGETKPAGKVLKELEKKIKQDFPE